ncbi:MAG: pirin family protein [Bdellovibrionales bacterium]|nr:pirin family protein [Bdellovibrionales bacterium]
MMKIRRSHERGHADHGWLKSYHSFSFADYYDPDNMGFRDLRVINEDIIAGGGGFPTHGHRDMEIVSYVLEGALEHQDSMGNKAQILPGEVQYMSAGTGVQHSEYNPRPTEATHLLQIWILPEQRGLKPRYGQKSFARELEGGELTLVVSRDGRQGSIAISQDADLHIARPRAGTETAFNLREGRYVYLQVLRGELNVNGEKLNPGDAVAVAKEQELKIRANVDSEYLLFDLN